MGLEGRAGKLSFAFFVFLDWEISRGGCCPRPAKARARISLVCKLATAMASWFFDSFRTTSRCLSSAFLKRCVEDREQGLARAVK